MTQAQVNRHDSCCYWDPSPSSRNHFAKCSVLKLQNNITRGRSWERNQEEQLVIFIPYGLILSPQHFCRAWASVSQSSWWRMTAETGVGCHNRTFVCLLVSWSLILEGRRLHFVCPTHVTWHVTGHVTPTWSVSKCLSEQAGGQVFKLH